MGWQDELNSDGGADIDGLDFLNEEAAVDDGAEDEAIDAIVEDEKNISEESTQEDEEVDNEEEDAVESADEGTEPKEPPAPAVDNDALGQALKRLEAKESEVARVNADLQQAQIQLSAPKFVPYDALPDDLQRAFDTEAARFGISPEQLVYDEFRKIQGNHEFNVRQAQAQQANASAEARREVDAFFDGHASKAKHGDAVIQSLLKAGWANLEPLLQSNPMAFKISALALINAAFTEAETKALIAGRRAKSQQAMKTATRSEATRTTAPSTTRPSADDGQDIFDFIAAGSNPLSKLKSMK